MSQLYHEFGVTLQRRSADEAWGIRLAGGSDLNSPLIIIRVKSIASSDCHQSSAFHFRDDLSNRDGQQVVRSHHHQHDSLAIKINFNPIHDTLSLALTRLMQVSKVFIFLCRRFKISSRDTSTNNNARKHITKSVMRRKTEFF
jgi:hypothetical protein